MVKGPKNSEISRFFNKHSLGSFSNSWGAFRKDLLNILSKPDLLKKGLKNRETALKFFDRTQQEDAFLKAVK